MIIKYNKLLKKISNNYIIVIINNRNLSNSKIYHMINNYKNI